MSASSVPVSSKSGEPGAGPGPGSGPGPGPGEPTSGPPPKPVGTFGKLTPAPATKSMITARRNQRARSKGNRNRFVASMASSTESRALSDMPGGSRPTY